MSWSKPSANRWPKGLRLIVVFLFVLGLFSYFLLLPFLYSFLDLSQPPHRTDVIVILGGSEGSRETYAAQLYHEGYAPTIIISGYSDEMAYNLQVLQENGVPASVITINDQATNTYNEAQQVLEILIDFPADSVLVVTDRFHTRRASATYRQAFHDHSIEVTFVSPSEVSDSTAWSTLGSQILMEYPKMLYYWLAYGIWSG